MSRVVGFVGSARKGGNTEMLVTEMLAGAAELGATTQSYNLTRLNIRGCTGCNVCQETGRCVLKDEMQGLYDEIYQAGALIIGSPVYMGHVSGQTKVFLDRFYAFMKPDMSNRLPHRIPVALVLAQGDPEVKNYAPAFKITADMLNFLGFKVVDTFVAAGLSEAGAVSKQPEVLAKARKLGAKLVK